MGLSYEKRGIKDEIIYETTFFLLDRGFRYL